MKNKSLSHKQKGQLGNLQGIVLTLVVVGVLLGAGFFILEEFAQQAETISGSNTSASYQGINDTITALANVPNLLGLIVLVAVIGIVLSVVFNVIPGARVTGA